jgi:uncharacterized protein
MVSALRTIGVVGCAFVIGGTLPRLAASPEPKAAPVPLPAPPAIVAPPRPSPMVQAAPRPPPPPSPPKQVLPGDIERAMVERARLEVLRGVRYDATYRALLAYPRGDVPEDMGACTDLVIRALRAVDVDLQVLVHEDVAAFPADYPFEDIGDASIDHRRVATLFAYFENNALSLDIDPRERHTFRPGDIVFYGKQRCTPGWPCFPRHVALVSDRIGPRGLPLLLQNGGPRAAESDALDQPLMVGHFRLMTTYLALRVHRE